MIYYILPIIYFILYVLCIYIWYYFRAVDDVLDDKESDWIANRKGTKDVYKLQLSAPVVAFLSNNLLVKVARVGDPPVKQVVEGAKTADKSKAARCCIDWAIKKFGAIADGKPKAVKTEWIIVYIFHSTFDCCDFDQYFGSRSDQDEQFLDRH